MDEQLLFDIQPLVSEKISQVFSDFAGKSCVQKPNKAQKKRAKKWEYSIFTGFGLAQASP